MQLLVLKGKNDNNKEHTLSTEFIKSLIPNTCHMNKILVNCKENCNFKISWINISEQFLLLLQNLWGEKRSLD